VVCHTLTVDDFSWRMVWLVYRTESLCHQNLISLHEVEVVVVGLEEEIVGEG
jgi:hypothetical protein